MAEISSALAAIGDKVRTVGGAAYLATPWGAQYRVLVDAVLAEEQAWAKLQVVAGEITDAMRAEVERRFKAETNAYRQFSDVHLPMPLRATAIDAVLAKVAAGTWTEDGA